MIYGPFYMGFLVCESRTVVRNIIFRRIFDSRKHFTFDHEILMHIKTRCSCQKFIQFLSLHPCLMISFDRKFPTGHDAKFLHKKSQSNINVQELGFRVGLIDVYSLRNVVTFLERSYEFFINRMPTFEQSTGSSISETRFFIP